MRKLLITIGLITGAASLFAAPIHDAARNANIEFIGEYIKSGNNINIKDEAGVTPIGYATEMKKITTAKFIAMNGGDLTSSMSGRRDWPVWISLKNDPDIIKLMIARNIDLNSKSGDAIDEQPAGQTPLFYLSNLESARLLIENGADLNVKDTSGQTPFSTSKSYDVAMYMLKKGANIQQKELKDYQPNSDGWYGYVLTDYLKNKVEDLEQQLKLKSNNTNPTDEWPRKLWEIELGEPIGATYFTVGMNNSIVLQLGQDSHWITKNGKHFRIENRSLEEMNIKYLSNKHLIYSSRNSLTLLTRNDELVASNIFNRNNIVMPSYFPKHSAIIGLNTNGTKLTGWDFTPPTLASTDNEGGNNGGNTAMSRLSIGTSGPDISIATDGKLGGPAELQKSNDLKNWRKLGDVPADSTELLITPRDSGNEFFRLKRVGE